MLTSLKGYLSRRRPPRVIRECRRCGTGVDSDASRCPDCGSAAIAVYEIP